MKASVKQHSIKLWLTSTDTTRWANGELGNGEWPCSMISGHRLYAEFDAKGLIDLMIDGEPDVESAELNAIVEDFLRYKVPTNNPIYDIVIAQKD